MLHKSIEVVCQFVPLQEEVELIYTGGYLQERLFHSNEPLQFRLQDGCELLCPVLSIDSLKASLLQQMAILLSVRRKRRRRRRRVGKDVKQLEWT